MQLKEHDSPVWIAKPTRQPMRILVIEDDREAASWLIKGLAESGHVADHAADGEAGLNLAQEGVHDVLIVDRMLPRIDGVTLDHRRKLDTIQRNLREHQGTTVIIYVQPCAAEKRRRRKHGVLADPPRRVFINPEV